MNEGWIPAREAAQMLGVKQSTLTKWRYRGKPPKIRRKLGHRTVLYLRREIMEMLHGKV